jgi:catechol 2,3-dioxygenase-like lactoylglutathione lyase family enzyme
MAAAATKPAPVAVHSVDHFCFSVPDLAEAERFYTAFGLDVRKSADRLDLYAFGHPHRWGAVHGNGKPKKMQYMTFGMFEQDVPEFRSRIERRGIGCDPHPLASREGLWFRDPDNIPVQLMVAPKVAPSVKSSHVLATAPAPGKGAAPSRSKAPVVYPRRLSHILRFTPEVARMLTFYGEVLGLRLSDKSADIIAFMHTPHGSDHHLVAFLKSERPGLHHHSWDVGSLDDVGAGSEQMRNRGYDKGWGVGRHVLGSNYFYYVRDPWGSFAEYSFDIDFVPPGFDWPAADHPPEDSLYVWGPPVPDYFATNTEE